MSQQWSDGKCHFLSIFNLILAIMALWGSNTAKATARGWKGSLLVLCDICPHDGIIEGAQHSMQSPDFDLSSCFCSHVLEVVVQQRQTNEIWTAEKALLTVRQTFLWFELQQVLATMPGCLNALRCMQCDYLTFVFASTWKDVPNEVDECGTFSINVAYSVECFQLFLGLEQ